MKKYEHETKNKIPGKSYLFIRSIFLLIPLFIVIGLILNGCAYYRFPENLSLGDFYPARGINYNDTIPDKVKLSHYKTIQVHVTSNIKKSKKYCCKLEDKIINLLRKKKFFEKVLKWTESQIPPPDLQLNAEITKLRTVTALERMMSYEGKSIIVVHNRLKDVKTGQELGSFTARGHSESGELASVTLSGTTRQAVKYAAKQIVKIFQTHM
jgi:hypothetical protein